VKEVRSLLEGEAQLSDEEAANGSRVLFTTSNINNNSSGSSISDVVDQIVASLVKKEISTETFNTP